MLRSCSLFLALFLAAPAYAAPVTRDAVAAFLKANLLGRTVSVTQTGPAGEGTEFERTARETFSALRLTDKGLVFDATLVYDIQYFKVEGGQRTPTTHTAGSVTFETALRDLGVNGELVGTQRVLTTTAGDYTGHGYAVRYRLQDGKLTGEEKTINYEMMVDDAGRYTAVAQTAFEYAVTDGKLARHEEGKSFEVDPATLSVVRLRSSEVVDYVER